MLWYRLNCCGTYVQYQAWVGADIGQCSWTSRSGCDYVTVRDWGM